MASALDMSLDDLIKSNKQIGGAGRGVSRGGKVWNRRDTSNPTVVGSGSYSGGKTGGAAAAAARRQANRTRARPNPYTAAAAAKNDTFEDGRSRSVGIETGTKLYISNLDYGVSNDDIRELFSEVGDLKRCSIHYDRSGRSKGTAEVVFSKKADGVSALKRYNNVQLDGKPMKIELVGTNLQIGGQRDNGNGAATTARERTVNMTAMSTRGGAGNSFGRRGGFASYRGRGRGRGNTAGRIPNKGSNVEVTAAALDAELETYHAEAMQTS